MKKIECSVRGFQALAKRRPHRIFTLKPFVGNEPASDFCVYQLMGNKCRILLQKKCKEGEDNIYYSVADIEEKGEGE